MECRQDLKRPATHAVRNKSSLCLLTKCRLKTQSTTSKFGRSRSTRLQRSGVALVYFYCLTLSA